MCRDELTALLPLSCPLFGCQVDRRTRAFGSVLRHTWLRLSILVTWLIAGAVANAQLELPARAPLGVVWEASLSDDGLYVAEVLSLLEAYERTVGHRLAAGARGKVGLKVNTRGGRGLSTPLPLLRAVVEALELRGFARQQILIVDHSRYDLRQAGFLPDLSPQQANFEGCPVLALDSERYYAADWFYDSPLPPAMQQETPLVAGLGQGDALAEGAQARKSFLPAPLLFEVDFWINLAVGVDDPTLGVDGALANATLWNVSNSLRFLGNPATASAAVAEIAAIPELHERMVLHLISLQRYQFIGGPRFNSLYSRSEPLLWMSSDPVALDRLLFERMNAIRLLEGFPEIEPLPQQLPFAASLGLGVFEPAQIQMRRLPPPAVSSNAAEAHADAREAELPAAAELAE
jgi:hypothetical protein